MKLSRVPVYLLLALALMAGRFAFAPAAGAEGCADHCDEHAEEAPAVQIDGGTVSSSTTIDISVDGGIGIADASGGDGNVAAVNAGTVFADIAAAGNGGTADASANGGAVSVGNVNSGGNSGNLIAVGNTNGGGECHECAPKPEKPDCDCAKPAPEKPAPAKPAPSKPAAPQGGSKVKALPSTGAGLVAGDTGANDALLLLATLGAVGAAGYGLRRRFI